MKGGGRGGRGPMTPPGAREGRRAAAAVTAVMVLLALAAPARGQDGQESVDGLRPGDRVRVWAPFAGFHGEDAAVAEEPGSRLLRLRRGGGHQEVPLEEIEVMKVERRVGNHMSDGALVGGVTGATVATLFLFPYCDSLDTGCGIDNVLGVFAVLGLPPFAVGSLVGLAVGRHEWMQVELSVRGTDLHRPVAGAARLEARARLDARVSLPFP